MKEKTFYIQTFGCQMNARDSAWLASALVKRGYSETGETDARVYILNTCSVREKPERKVADAIKSFYAKTSGDESRLVAVLGCVAQQRADSLFAISPQLRLVAGSDGIIHVPDEIDRLLDEPEKKNCFTDFTRLYPEREKTEEGIRAGSAFVNIMQGCDNFCSYCIVPFTRGRQKSRMPGEILQECASFISSGASELILLGQNVNAYGKDLAWQDFVTLLRQIASLPGLERLRFVTPHPADMDGDIVGLFGELENLCPRLHLPLQSGSDKILKSMRRRYDRKVFLDLARRLRLARPDLALSTDLIVGFPGETEEDFEATLEMMRECGFMSSYSFCYSDRPGTRASLMPGKIEPETMLKRLGRLQSLQAELSDAWLAARVGQKARVLMETPAPRQKDGKTWQGKDEYGVTVTLENENARPGMYCDVIISAAKKHTLAGKLIAGQTGERN